MIRKRLVRIHEYSLIRFEMQKQHPVIFLTKSFIRDKDWPLFFSSSMIFTQLCCLESQSCVTLSVIAELDHVIKICWSDIHSTKRKTSIFLLKSKIPLHCLLFSIRGATRYRNTLQILARVIRPKTGDTRFEGIAKSGCN